MYRYDQDRQRLAIGLAFLAGQVDSTGFLVAGGYFTSFMSGNTTRLGVALIESPLLAILPAAIIACFLAGVVGGAMVAARWPGRHKRVLLSAVAVLLGAAAEAARHRQGLAFLGIGAVAMGLSNNVFSRDGGVTVGVTYMTGALVRFGQGLAARLGARPLDTMRGYGALWSALAAGAVSGAWLYSLDPVRAPLASFGLALLLCAYAFRIERIGGSRARTAGSGMP